MRDNVNALNIRGTLTVLSLRRSLSLPQTHVSVRPGVVLDIPPVGRSFGDVLTQPAPAYARGACTTATPRTCSGRSPRSPGPAGRSPCPRNGGISPGRPQG